MYIILLYCYVFGIPEAGFLKELEDLQSPRVFGSHIKFKDQPPGVKQGKCKVRN